MGINKRQIRAILLVTAACCGIYLTGYGLEGVLHERQAARQRALLSSARQVAAGNSGVEEPETESGNDDEVQEKEDPVHREVLPEFQELLEQNADLAGWLRIGGTAIDYPVMRTEDGDYYLDHNFQRQRDRHGCLFLNEEADIRELPAHSIIYGHNMKDGSMFGELDRYQDRKFFEEHRTFEFNTLYERGSYEIVSVFLSRVYRQGEEAFRYYQATDLSGEEDFYDFTGKIKELSLYETGVEPEPGDRLLTLSTCVYHVENGRIAVVARKINSSSSD